MVVPMTNSDRVLSFVQKHSGHTQKEISLKLGITPEQQVNAILRKLLTSGCLIRQSRDGSFRYYASSTASHTKQPSGRKEQITRVTPGRSPGESKEQQGAESWLVSQLAQRLGIRLEKRRLQLEAGGWLELDGICETPLVLCEAWAHVGSPKSAQKNKVMADAFKIVFADGLLGGGGRRVLLFGDSKAAAHFLGKSWMVECLNRNGITVEVIELPPSMKAEVLAAQQRQYR